MTTSPEPMAILTTCCRRSVRDGSFIAGIYTLVLYMAVVIVGTFYLNSLLEPALLGVTLLSVVLAGFCVVTSVILIVGVCVVEMPYLGGLFIIDSLLACVNVYCLLCVISQYQEYRAGRGRPEDNF
ncbi:uncharacterized protein LOC106467905 isoform X3 [Limulus polyphemus]|uniref:Uncharacterized protein LOC106467905 isoform X3 n=1 Tax=Limulus polyphemus TaxID=6850 RepID=A0ABM1T7H7_LIMPO|nr:uncharacterized protein LOC106467905 isoform X3 [Limulus polyphemus]